MPELIHLPQYSEERGSLTVWENVFSKEFFIKQADGHISGKHSHLKQVKCR